MDERDVLAERFDAERGRLCAVAYRMLGSFTEAEDADTARQRTVVDAFLAAARGGDFEALVAVLDPDVVLRADTAAGLNLRFED
jgi:RNA polymerase sigma-70 factor (ECF subfamily)